MKSLRNCTSMRPLSDSELHFVSGGTDPAGQQAEPEIVVYARESSGSGGLLMTIPEMFSFNVVDFMQQQFDGGYHITQNVPAPVNEDGDIVIEATPEMVEAAKEAYRAAGIVVTGSQALASVAGVFIKNRAAGASVAGASTMLSADGVREFVAESLYYLDGSDGVYDGRYAPSPFYNPPGSGNQDVPETFPTN